MKYLLPLQRDKFVLYLNHIAKVLGYFLITKYLLDYFLKILKKLKTMVLIRDRIVHFIENCGLPYQQIEKKIGVSNGFVGKIVKGSSFNVNILDDFLIAFPNLNPLWLIAGEGEMFIDADDKLKIHQEDIKKDFEFLKQEMTQKIEILHQKMQSFAV